MDANFTSYYPNIPGEDFNFSTNYLISDILFIAYVFIKLYSVLDIYPVEANFLNISTI